MKHNVADWLIEQDVASDSQPGQPAAQSPTSDPNQGMSAQAAPDPNVANQQQTQQQSQPEPQPKDSKPDVTADPSAPDMPEDKKQVNDFEVWKGQYLKESIKGDTTQLMEMLNQVRDKEGLHPYHRKFVEDNFNIQLVRQHSNVDKASREIRKNIKDQLDRNNPSTSVVNHMSAVLETIPVLNQVFIKLNGYTGLKGDLHRKYLAALLGGVQVGSGGNNEDIIYNEKEYSILVSSRFNSRWGDVMLGSWSLRQDDPEKYLTEPELKRFQEGSPEEKTALRHRVVIESISKMFETRAFIINVVGIDGSVHTLGWDIASSLRAAFTEGKIVVKMSLADNGEALIDADGNVVALQDISIAYVKETGQQDDEGKPEKEYIQFVERRDGTLFLTATHELIKEASTALQGMSYKEVPYAGNPSDLLVLSRCIYSSHDMLMRAC